MRSPTAERLHLISTWRRRADELEARAIARPDAGGDPDPVLLQLASEWRNAALAIEDLERSHEQAAR